MHDMFIVCYTQSLSSSEPRFEASLLDPSGSDSFSERWGDPSFSEPCSEAGAGEPGRDSSSEPSKRLRLLSLSDCSESDWGCGLLFFTGRSLPDSSSSELAERRRSSSDSLSEAMRFWWPPSSDPEPLSRFLRRRKQPGCKQNKSLINHQITNTKKTLTGPQLFSGHPHPKRNLRRKWWPWIWSFL